MKVRNSFVSNSSSSSFIVLFPPSFNPDTVDLAKHKADDEVDEDELRQGLKKLIGDGEYWAEESYGIYYALCEVIRPYTIASMETGPDAGQIVLADRQKVEKVLNEK